MCVSDTRNQSLAKCPCRGRSLASDGLSIAEDNVTFDASKDAELASQPAATTSALQQHCDDDAIQCRVSSPHANDNEAEPRDSGVFPVKPAQRTAAASCPSSPASDVVRTSAEGRAGDGHEQTESDDVTTPS